jgi:hypothetical protein
VGRVVVTGVIFVTMALAMSPDAWAKTTTFGGYVATATASASADITVPAASSITCSSTQASMIEFEVALLKGEYPAQAGLVIDCVKGSPITYVIGSVGTASVRFTVNGGDVIAISVSETGTATTLTADDTTTTVNETANFTGATTTPTGVQFGATSTAKTLPRNGPVTFSSVDVDGVQLVAANATERKLVRSKNHPPGIVPGAISSGSFTLSDT